MFEFGNVFVEHLSNVEIYKHVVMSLIPGVFWGKWVDVFAYGQTGSGKTVSCVHVDVFLNLVVTFKSFQYHILHLLWFLNVSIVVFSLSLVFHQWGPM